MDIIIPYIVFSVVLICLAAAISFIMYGNVKFVDEKRLAKEEAEAKAARASRAAEKRRKAAKKKKLIDSVEYVIRSDGRRGYHTKSEIGWVSVKAESRQVAESELSYKAALRGANAIVKLHFTVNYEEYKAGTGPKGNPYYRTKKVTLWEGLAIKSDKKVENTDNYNIHPVSEENGRAVVDGSNVLYWKDGTPCISSLKMVITKLIADGLEVHVVFDANIGHVMYNKYVSEFELSK